MNVEIQDNSKEVSAAIKEALLRGLEKEGKVRMSTPSEALERLESLDEDWPWKKLKSPSQITPLLSKAP